MKRTLIWLPVVVVAALVAVVALIGASPAEAQGRSKPLPQFVPKHMREQAQGQWEQAEKDIKKATTAQKRAKQLQKVVDEGAEELSKDLSKKEAAKRSAKQEYTDLLNEAEETKREIKFNFSELIKEHFSCVIQQIAGEEECRKDKKKQKEPRSDRGGGGENCPFYEQGYCRAAGGRQ